MDMKNQDMIKRILDRIRSREDELLSDYGIEDYDSFDDVDLDELDDIDIDGKKAIQDLVEYKNAVLKVDELVKEKADSSDPKVLHRTRKDFEMAITRLRSIKAVKNEEIEIASSICTSIDELIAICKQGAR